MATPKRQTKGISYISVRIVCSFCYVKKPCNIAAGLKGDAFMKALIEQHAKLSPSCTANRIVGLKGFADPESLCSMTAEVGI